MTKTEMLSLPRAECSIYIDGQYVARGPVLQALGPATHGWFGHEPAGPERIEFEFDAPSGRVRLTAAEFVGWLRRA